MLSTPRVTKYSEIYEKAQQMGIVDSIMSHELPSVMSKTEKGYSKLMREATQATGWVDPYDWVRT